MTCHWVCEEFLGDKPTFVIPILNRLKTAFRVYVSNLGIRFGCLDIFPFLICRYPRSHGTLRNIGYLFIPFWHEFINDSKMICQ